MARGLEMLGTLPPGPRPCTIAAALGVLGERWSLLAIRELSYGVRRFDQIAKFTGASRDILADRLRRLEAVHVIRTTPYSQRPPRFVYELSDDGAELAGALRLLADWGARVARDAEPMRHAACGTPLEARWYCPTCARAVESAEADQVRYV